MIGNHNPILQSCNAPESLIEADISVNPRNLDARLTPFSPSLILTMAINIAEVTKYPKKGIGSM